MYSLPHNPIICCTHSFLDLADVAILAMVSALTGPICAQGVGLSRGDRPDPDNSTRFISNLQPSSLIQPFSTHIYFAARRFHSIICDQNRQEGMKRGREKSLLALAFVRWHISSVIYRRPSSCWGRRRRYMHAESKQFFGWCDRVDDRGSNKQIICVVVTRLLGTIHGNMLLQKYHLLQ